MEEVKHKSGFIEILKKAVSKLSPALKCIVSEKNDDDEPDMNDSQVKLFFETAEKVDRKFQSGGGSNSRRSELQKQLDAISPKSSKTTTKVIEMQKNNSKDRDRNDD